ncbi:hypothetical protein JYK14_09590 [Siccirubricoccus sp. KC 17139]|uniref:Uncharacterized protein n=1 Tax=Siccirubricoccus soli TaxID=2899147 RepID=A0ABT1D3C2_9PROT|nr:hypothetical protein [Siccirubricoccus soli]MCO6416418.1 hypothetical protein [Siccirubricoccus soli]MCP2682552.1 hypothetical protein [Siccirubricoccus soli]
MFLPRCNPLAMAGTAMGGLAVMTAVGPFLAGIGVGAGIVGGACLARRAMRKRSEWRDEPASDLPPPEAMPDEGVPM